jgi:hypothetical protein
VIVLYCIEIQIYLVLISACCIGMFSDLCISLFFLSYLQGTVTREGEEVELRGKGRHDPCVLPRAVPMVEAMVAMTLLDALMLQTAQCELIPNEASLETRPNPMGMTAHREGGPAIISSSSDEEGDASSSKPISQQIDEE